MAVLQGGKEQHKYGFGWSKSRDGAFRQCQLGYYLSYYAGRDGWIADVGSKERELYTMKNLSARPLLLGIDVHETVAWIIQRAKSYHSLASIEEAERKLRKDMLFDWLCSIKHDYLGSFKQPPGLQEDYYLQGLAPEDFEKDWAHALLCLRNFMQSRAYTSLIVDPAQGVVEVEKLGTLSLRDVPLWVKSDLILRDAEGRFTIIDWKTGREVDDAEAQIQLGVYALYAVTRLEALPEHIEVIEENLLTRREVRYPVTEQLLHTAQRGECIGFHRNLRV